MAAPNMGSVVGDMIRRRRKALKMTQKEVGEFVGVTQQSVARWEDGQLPDEEHLDKLSEFLDVSDGLLSAAWSPLTRGLYKLHDNIDVVALLRSYDGKTRLDDPWEDGRRPPAEAMGREEERLATIEQELRSQRELLDEILRRLQGTEGSS